MLLRELFVGHKSILIEGGNLEIDGHQAQHIDLKVHQRSFIVPILNQLLEHINSAYQATFKQPLWSPELIKNRKFLSGSSLHFFNTDISDKEFIQKKPKVGDIDTQVNKDNRHQIEQFLKAAYGKQIGPAKFIGYKLGNEQFSSLWELKNPPIKIQIDLEFVEYTTDTNEPTEWAQFSHSSDWGDLSQGVKGVFHKYLMRALTSGTISQKYIQMKTKVKGPIVDNDVSFAVSSKQGGGMRIAYEPVIDPETNQPKEINGIPVVREIPTAQSHYEQNLSKQFEMLFGQQPDKNSLKLLWSFVGGLDLANKFLDDNARQQVADSFTKLLYGPGAQGLYKGDPERDAAEKGIAFNLLISKLKMPSPEAVKTQANQLAQTYYAKYKTVSLNEAEVKAQLRKGMPHLRALKPTDFLDLLDEIHDGNGNFKLENIPLNVKVDGFGGRFGKDSQGKPFMGTSNRPPRYDANFLKHHQEKGTEDPEILHRAQLFDNLFDEMMHAVKIVDSKLGSDFLINKQVTCEVLYLPFATETPDGRLKFVGIHYDKLPEGVQLALVPFRVVDAETGEDLPDATKIVKKLTGLGKQGKVMFIDNSLTQNGALDVTELVPPMENLNTLRAMLQSKEKGINDRKAQVAAALEPVKLALEKAIIEDPNIIGKDMLGKDYEGIVLNTRLGPVKVTSSEQKKIIADKNAAQTAARTEQPRGNQNKTAVVAIGSFVGHKGHEQLWEFTRNKAAEVGGDPYLFIGNAVGKDDPIPPNVKIQTWHKLYPEWSKNISTVMQGGQLIQKIKHELINPLPGKPPRYDNIIIMVGEDQANMNIANALMKAVNKFQGYEHVKVSLETTPRGTGIKFTDLRNALTTGTPEQQLHTWERAFDVKKLGQDWIKHLMDLTKQGMGLPINIKQANKVIREMRAKEFTQRDLKEDRKMPRDSTSATPGMQTWPALDNNNSPYSAYRFGVLMAGAGPRHDLDPENHHYPPVIKGPVGGQFVTLGYTKGDEEILDNAKKLMGITSIQKTEEGSFEEEDTNIVSPVAKPKRNKYGI